MSPKQKAPEKLMDSINLESKHVAANYGVEKRAECIAKTPSFITLKDHKDNFLVNPARRLINPSKNDLGKNSKNILDQTNMKLRETIYINQWKNKDDVIIWFD